MASGEELADRIPWAKFAEAAWTADDAGFFYGRFPEPPPDAAYDAPNHDMELRYHRVGTDAADDVLVLATPDEPEWSFEPEVDDDGRLLVISVFRGTDPVNRVYVADLDDGIEHVVVRPLIDVADAHYTPIGTAHGVLYLETDRDAPLGRVVAIDIRQPRADPGGHPGRRRTRSSRSASSGTGSPPCTSTTPTTGWRCSSSTGGT